MKRFFTLLMAGATTFMTWSCQEKIDLDTHIDIQIGSEVESVHVDSPLDYDEIMPLNRNLTTGAQGGDCWGDYFFQFVDGNSRVRVFDLSKKKLIQTIYIPSSQRGFVPNCHCNTVCFGTEYYDTEDHFPLIYASTGYPDDKEYTGALVYRLTEENGVFSLSLVQTVRFPKSITSWTEFVPAGDYGYLCYTRQRIIYKVNMPKLKEGDIIDIDIPGASISARVSDEEFDARRATYEAPAPTVTSGWLVRYQRYVDSAAHGAVMK